MMLSLKVIKSVFLVISMLTAVGGRLFSYQKKISPIHDRNAARRPLSLKAHEESKREVSREESNLWTRVLNGVNSVSMSMGEYLAPANSPQNGANHNVQGTAAPTVSGSPSSSHFPSTSPSQVGLLGPSSPIAPVPLPTARSIQITAAPGKIPTVLHKPSIVLQTPMPSYPSLGSPTTLSPAPNSDPTSIVTKPLTSGNKVGPSASPELGSVTQQRRRLPAEVIAAIFIAAAALLVIGGTGLVWKVRQHSAAMA